MKDLFVLLFAFMSISANAQRFTVISTENGRSVYPKGISSDGKYVAGQIGIGSTYTGHHSFVWTEENGLQELDSLLVNELGQGPSAYAVSSSGRIAGVAPDFDHPVTEAGNTVPYPLITAAYKDYNSADWNILSYSSSATSLYYNHYNRAYAITDDGNIIVGGQTPGGQAEWHSAGYWDVSDPDNITFHVLGGNDSEIQAVSGDGSVMGGGVDTQPVLWINGVKKEISGSSGYPVVGISNNGKYAVFRHNFRSSLYDIENEQLIAFDQGATFSIPAAVSDNGVVVGYWSHMQSNLKLYQRAYIYSSTLGMMSLESYLTREGISFAMDSLLVASGISKDGRKIIGYGMRGGKTCGFFVEIPEIAVGLVPVKEPAIESPGYGKVRLTWTKPDVLSGNGVTLTGYAVYKDSATQPLVVIDNILTSMYIDNAVTDGTHEYVIKAVYDDNGTSKESIAGKNLYITMGKKTLPFFDDFSDYQPGGAIIEVHEILKEIPLSTGYWDVTANTLPFSNSWKVQEFGFPHWCAGILAPMGGLYEESLVSPYFDAGGVTNLHLSFNVRTPNSSQERMAVEIFDGSNWTTIDDLPANGRDNYTFKTYDVSQLAGKSSVRFRFRSYGLGTSQIRWQVDNVELADEATQITVEDALVVLARKADDGTAHVNWSDPNGCVELRYMWDDAAFGRLGNDKYPVIAANMYPAEDLKAYEGYKLTSISFWRTTNPNGSLNLPAPEFKWFVAQDGVRLCDLDVEDVQLGWNRVQLSQPIEIDVTKPLYYGVEVVSCDPRDTPLGSGAYMIEDPNNPGAGLYLTIADGRGNLYSEDGGVTWHKISETPNFEYELYCIRATLAKDPSVEPKKAISGYTVYRNGVDLISLQMGMGGNLLPLNNYTDIDPLPDGEDACYTVKTYYSLQQYSDGKTFCIDLADISLIADENGIKIYPNIIRKGEIIMIELPDNDFNAILRIYDLSGKKVKEILAESPVSFDKSGIYILKINSVAVKVIVQ
ncbi:MAG: T9SS type A sorting domain-containing protein [Dysgonamonadaceae bacterium]|jgi:uncharacterized membrane protein|nr:T9SS type A sorting domain-containing protein [Dysgonamonadaceae bacterium]